MRLHKIHSANLCSLVFSPNTQQERGRHRLILSYTIQRPIISSLHTVYTPNYITITIFFLFVGAVNTRNTKTIRSLPSRHVANASANGGLRSIRNAFKTSSWYPCIVLPAVRSRMTNSRIWKEDCRHMRNLANVIWRGGKSTMGIRNLNLRSS
jgi:hypothetical protein